MSQRTAAIPCPYCGEFAMRSHQLRCVKRRMQCPGCLSDVSAAAFDAHCAQCPEGELRCPGCSVRVIRRELEQHIRAQCQATSWRCSECGQAFFAGATYLKHTTPRCMKQVVSCQLCSELILSGYLADHLVECSQRSVGKARQQQHQQQARSGSAGELSPWQQEEQQPPRDQRVDRSPSTSRAETPRRRTPSATPNGGLTPRGLQTTVPVVRQLHLESLHRFSQSNKVSPRRDSSPPQSSRQLYAVPPPGYKRNTTASERALTPRPGAKPRKKKEATLNKEQQALAIRRDRSRSPLRYSAAPSSRVPSPHSSAPASRQTSHASNPTAMIQTFAMLPRSEQVQMSKDLRLAHLSAAIRRKDTSERDRQTATVNSLPISALLHKR